MKLKDYGVKRPISIYHPKGNQNIISSVSLLYIQQKTAHLTASGFAVFDLIVLVLT